MATATEQSGVTARDGKAFTFTRNRGSGTAEFFPGAGARIRFASADTDTLSLPGLPAGLLQQGDLVTVAYKGTTVFHGSVATITERHGRGTDLVEDVTAEGPWGAMSRLVFRQAWAVGGDGAQMTRLSSRLVLNTTPEGAGQDMTAQVREIASYAAGMLGFEASDADIDAGSQVLPPDEARDITCADAIRRTLRFFPQTICRFDYSDDAPALHVEIPPASPSQASYIASIPKTQRTVTRTAHPVERVDIATSDADTSIEGSPVRAFSHQVYPPYPSGVADTPDTLHVFMPLEKGGASSTWESLDVNVLAENDSVYGSINFWIRNHPALAGFQYLPPGQAYSGTGNMVAFNGQLTPATLPYPRLTDTTVGDLERFGLHAEVVRLTLPVKIYTPDKEESQVLTLDYVCTDATGRTYTRQTGSSSTAGETLPDGLAEAIYRQRSGAVTAVDMTVRLEASLPTLGDALLEAGETLYLQDFEVDCYDLTARLHFGKPAFLSPEDMRDLLLGFRQRAFAANAPDRGDPDEAQDAEDVGGVQPLKSSSTVVSSVAKATVQGTAGQGKIVLEAAQVDEGNTIATAKLTFTDAEGEEKEVQILGSEDVAIPPGGGDANVAADPDASVKVDGKEIYASVRTDDGTGTLLVGLSESAPPEPEGSEGYCNSVSADGRDQQDPENDISGDGHSGGGGSINAPDNNSISRDPCKKEPST